MLVIAFSGLNIEQAVIYQTGVNVNHSIHLIPQEGNVLIHWIIKMSDFTVTL